MPGTFHRTLKLFCMFLFTSTVTAQAPKNTELVSSYKPRGTVSYSDIWGYSNADGEYAIIGSRFGTSFVDVTDPELPQEVAFVQGPTSIWRDIKTYRDHAYIITDSNENGYSPAGVQVVDLSGLPGSVRLVTTVATGLPGGMAHNLFVEKNFLYVIGGRGARGVVIFDLTTPGSPRLAGSWQASYWHDVVVKNDTLYGADIYGGTIEIVDVRDKSNMQLISRTEVPNGFTHNLWVTDDNAYLVQTDEVHGLPVNFWDVSDHLQPQRVATYYGGDLSIAHNATVRGDMAFVSYYYDGLKIFDLSQRSAPVEVGWYDTFPNDGGFRGEGYEGAWGIYPFLPSGNLLISDISSGLIIVRFNGAEAGYVQGLLRDARSGEAMSEVVQITMPDYDENDGEITAWSRRDGSFVYGALPGERTLRFSAFGYLDTTISLTLNEGQTLQQDISLIPLPQSSVLVQVSSTPEADAAISGSEVILASGEKEFVRQLDEQGRATFALPFGDYEYSFIKWGYLSVIGETAIDEESEEISISTAPAYHETFTRSVGWKTSSPEDDSRFTWEIMPAAQQPYGARLLYEDYTGDHGGYVAVSRARYGSSTLTSPVFDATSLEEPKLSFAKFYNPYYWGSAQANDTLIVEISNDGGGHWLRIDAFTAIDKDWQSHSYELENFITLSDQMVVRFINREAENDGTRASAFCLLDEVLIRSGVMTSVDRDVPVSIQLFQNYPNPFSASGTAFAGGRGTTIRWQQPAAGPATLQLYNLIGQLVLEVPAGQPGQGNRTMVVDMQNLPAGIYLYKIKSRGFESGIRKMTYLK